MNVSIRELECFMAVAEELSFTRAAERLGLAQPPLSRHVRVLEDKLGTRLIERTNRRVALSPAGMAFYEEARLILPQLARAADVAQRVAQGQTQQLRLGFVGAVLGDRLISLLREFRRVYPSVQVSMLDLAPADQLSGIERGTLDGGFVGLAPRSAVRGIRFVRWYRDPLRCYVPAEHPLAEVKQVGWKDLRPESWIMVARESAPAFREFVDQRCTRVGFRPRVVLESPRAQGVAVMVAAGAGITVLPESLSVLAGSALRGIPFRERTHLMHVFASRRHVSAGSPADRLVRLMRPGRSRDQDV